MRHPALRFLAPLLAALAMLPACLPDGYTDEELLGRVACGTGGQRHALDVNSALVLTRAEGTKFAFDPGQDWSYSVWFQAHTLPAKGKVAPFVGTLASQEVANVAVETAFAMALSGPTEGTDFVRPVCLFTRTGKAGGAELAVGVLNWRESVTAGTWHHMRCWFDSSAGDLYLSIDGANPEEQALTIADGKAATDAQVLVGAVPLPIAAAVHYDGLLDEVHIARGISPTKINAVPTREPDGDSKSVLLLHMDDDVGRGTLTDSSAKPSVAVQVTLENKVLTETGKPLPFAAQNCYGFDFAQAACSFSATGRAPWCKTL